MQGENPPDIAQFESDNLRFNYLSLLSHTTDKGLPIHLHLIDFPATISCELDVWAPDFCFESASDLKEGVICCRNLATPLGTVPKARVRGSDVIAIEFTLKELFRANMSSTPTGDALENSMSTSEISATPLQKRRLSDTPEVDSSSPAAHQNYCPSNTQILKVLRNDSHSKTICLHVKFADCVDKDGIIILQKSPFPLDVDGVCKAHLGVANIEGTEKSNFPEWDANKVVDNDIYHRYNVTAGLESVNNVSMTVIHPAEAHHFAKYTASRRRIIQETPEIYNKAIVPFLVSHPKDLSWVDNILNGTAEVERVLYTDEDDAYGFKFLLDYKWDGHQLNELHALGLARDPSLMCLRDLRAHHVPMLKKMLKFGRRELVTKYGSGQEGENVLREDQVMAYFHYPPTFYRLHMHFVNVDGAADGGTQAGKAHIAEDVIANLEMKSDYYADRTLCMYLHENHPFMVPIRKMQEDQEAQ